VCEIEKSGRLNERTAHSFMVLDFTTLDYEVKKKCGCVFIYSNNCDFTWLTSPSDFCEEP